VAARDERLDVAAWIAWRSEQSPFAIASPERVVADERSDGAPIWPLRLAVGALLAVALFLSVLIVTLVCVDGQADMVDGAASIGLYAIVAVIFWWD